MPASAGQSVWAQRVYVRAPVRMAGGCWGGSRLCWCDDRPVCNLHPPRLYIDRGACHAGLEAFSTWSVIRVSAGKQLVPKIVTAVIYSCLSAALLRISTRHEPAASKPHATTTDRVKRPTVLLQYSYNCDVSTYPHISPHVTTFEARGQSMQLNYQLTCCCKVRINLNP
jgi:hypothetical protein